MATEAKRPKLDIEDLKTLNDFQVKKVLNEFPDSKKIFLEGRMAGDKAENPAILTLEKTPFNPLKIDEILKNSQLKLEFKNDIYGQYECQIIDPSLNGIKTNLIYPATQRHIEKYISSNHFIIEETPALYKTVTLPCISSQKFTLDWIYNILEHKKEVERIVYEDPDPNYGFLMVPDFKWDGKQIDDLYLLAIVHNRSLKSIRDLNHRHLPLLKKIWNDCTKAIEEKYGVHKSQIRAYFHYQPSFYHLHVHFTHLKFTNAPGAGMERCHLLTNVIENIEKQSNYYATVLIPFSVKESDKLFQAYKDIGYDFGLKDIATNGQTTVIVNNTPNTTLLTTMEDKKIDKLFEFFQSLGKAKHEPCGEHWTVTYGESAWRLAIMAMCLSPELDRKRLIKMALTSAFTCFGKVPDQDSEWEDKLREVRNHLCELLPLNKAAELFELYSCHVNARKGTKHDSIEARAYRKLLELEEAILLWEELQVENPNSNTTGLLKKMKEVGFPGMEKIQVFQDDSELVSLLSFFLKISEGTRIKRTGWVQNGIRDPERIAGHMFRMAVMAVLFDEDVHDKKILNGKAMIISLLHDMGECIIGDITPAQAEALDPTKEDKQTMETNAFLSLAKQLPTGRMSLEFFNAFERYEEQAPEDYEAIITKDLDKFDMIMQAYEYEKKAKKGLFLQSFFDSTKGVFKTPQVQAWDKRLRDIRNQLFLNV